MSGAIEPPERAWYRQPLVWMVIGIPASSVVMGIFLIGISVYSYDGLVADDYYRRGLQINRVLSRDQEAATQGLRGDITIDPVTRTVEVHVESGPGSNVALPERLALRLIHPARADADRSVMLRLRGAGKYAGEIAPLEPGRWHLLLETDRWRLVGRLPVPGTGWAEFSPQG